ncbi:hypothetical protein [Nonlabens tegetincola]|uniref:hypothetical protein n=1 Tax=Nonlabens tegetincola TaxID=323273 RepID=UPI001FCF7D44|nr:hypothetical protein [Nonlabens tegetincola]
MHQSGTQTAHGSNQPQNYRPSQQQDQVNLFSTLFLVKGILNLLLSLLFLIYIGLGSFMTFIPIENQETPFNPGIIFTAVGIIGLVICIVFGILTIKASNNLKKRKGYTFIIVMAVLNALTGVLGILLCVFTIIEISKPHIKTTFEDS